MRKIISVLLAVLMIFSTVAVIAMAVPACNCGPAHTESADCLCCIYCPGLPKGRIVSCATKNADGEYEYCCGECAGYIGKNGTCGCTKCECCSLNDDGTTGKPSNPIGGEFDEVWDEEAQNNFVNGFQAILKRISDAFDRIFNAIFEFLRLDEVLGRN